MSNKVIRFEDLPEAVAYLVDCAEKILLVLQRIEGSALNKEQWMDVEQLIEYLPNHPAKTTIYSWSSRDLIPSHRVGKMLSFLRTEIDAWIKDSASCLGPVDKSSKRKHSRRKQGGHHV